MFSSYELLLMNVYIMWFGKDCSGVCYGSEANWWDLGSRPLHHLLCLAALKWQQLLWSKWSLDHCAGRDIPVYVVRCSPLHDIEGRCTKASHRWGGFPMQIPAPPTSPHWARWPHLPPPLTPAVKESHRAGAEPLNRGSTQHNSTAPLPCLKKLMTPPFYPLPPPTPSTYIPPAFRTV